MRKTKSPLEFRRETIRNFATATLTLVRAGKFAADNDTMAGTCGCNTFTIDPE